MSLKGEIIVCGGAHRITKDWLKVYEDEIKLCGPICRKCGKKLQEGDKVDGFWPYFSDYNLCKKCEREGGEVMPSWGFSPIQQISVKLLKAKIVDEQNSIKTRIRYNEEAGDNLSAIYEQGKHRGLDIVWEWLSDQTIADLVEKEE